MNYSKKIASLGIGCLLAVASTHASAQIISQWTFENDAVAENNTPAPSTGTGTADSIGMTNTYPNSLGTSTTYDDILVGKSSDTGVNGVADTTNTWRVRAAGSTPGNGWNSAAPIASQGAQFFVPTTNITTGAIQVTFDWYATTQGEANLELAYTTNGGTSWTDAPITLGGNDTGLQVLTNTTSANTVSGSYVSDNLLSNSKAGQDWFTGLTATITNPAALGDAGFGIEMVNASTGVDDISTQGTALNNTSGNWRFDNVTVAAVPEPSAWALAVIVALAFVGLRRRTTGRSL